MVAVLAWGQCAGQFIENPSLEGPTGFGRVPPSWEAFGEFSTPDTDPAPCDPYSASDGETYITLVIRGENHPQAGTAEQVYTSLQQPIEAGRYYRLKMDLASREDMGHFTWEEGYVSYDAPVFLRIYGEDGILVRGELLEASETIGHHNWESYTFYLVPISGSSGLILEIAARNSTSGWGNLVLDNLEMEEIDELPLHAGPLEIPNVFTPNGDGINDELIIKGLRNGSLLRIYNRTGREVFGSTDYRQNWDGTDPSGRKLPEGTYWYVLAPSNLEEVIKGFLYLKRE